VTGTGLRIAVVAASWEAESAEHTTHIADLSAAVSRQGHEVALYVRRDAPGQPESQRTPHGYDLVRVPAGPPVRLSNTDLLPHLDAFATYLDDEWSRQAPDVVHLHSWLSGLAVRDADAPLVQSFHGLDVVEYHFRGVVVRRRTDPERLVALGSDRVVAASSEELFALARLDVPRSNLSLVPWGVDTDRFRPDGPTAPRGAVRRIVALGEVAPRSGFQTAISALAAVPDAELLVVGPIGSPVPHEDPEVVRLVEHARKHGVADRVRFTGQVDPAELPLLLRSADVAVCPQWRASSGASSLRAMACGVPVIASATGALTDIVIDGVTGVLVPPRDPLALGRALRDLLSNPLRCEAYASSSVARARARYRWERVAADLVGTYRRAIRGRRACAIAER
jgi:glycosyltransferase involved in cell wall biosynthesis